MGEKPNPWTFEGYVPVSYSESMTFLLILDKRAEV